MSLGTDSRIPWQAKTAFGCSALFALTSISTNAVYGWSKGDTLPSQIIWAALAIATGATLLLATAALFKALAARRYGQAIFIALGLSLCATYSIVAAVGSATGQRVSAALSEDNAASQRKSAQKAIDEATAHIAQLPANRPSAAISAEVQGILLDPRLDGCKEINGPRTREKCPHVADLRKELATAQSTEGDRTRWQDELNKARTDLKHLPPPRVVNSDAQALVSFLAALGYTATVAQINTALALLSVLLIEMGGSVSLAVGMALSLPEPDFGKPLRAPLSEEPKEPLSQPAPLSPAQPNEDAGLKGLQEDEKQPLVAPLSSVRDRLLADVNGAKGGLRSTYEGLGKRYGVTATRIGQIVRELKKEGIVRVRSSRNGTTIVPALGLAATI